MNVVATFCTAMLAAQHHFCSIGLPKLSKKDLKSVHKLLAMHFYMTCMLFVCIKKTFSRGAIEALS